PSVTGSRPTSRVAIASAASFNVSSGVQSCTLAVMASLTLMMDLVTLVCGEMDDQAFPPSSRHQRQFDGSGSPIGSIGCDGAVRQKEPAPFTLRHHEFHLVDQEFAGLADVVDLA